jgi:UDP-N-acetylmuramoylalanine--D-glutamate ligase
MGLGVLGGGVGVSRYLVSRGAIVTVTDMRQEAELAGPLAELARLPITFHLGGHDIDDFRASHADIVVRNPGVPYDSPYILAARADDVVVEMEMSIFFRACPAPILAVTGTKGKTTVSSLLGEILTSWRPHALLAGNMGVSALLELDRLERDTPVVLELSSFQIEALVEHMLAPHVAVLTNISEDHLDRYKDFAEYSGVKRGLAHAMTEEDVVVYNSDDPEVARVVTETRARLVPFALAEPPGDGAWLESGRDLMLRSADATRAWKRPDVLSLQGDHGAMNALAAVAAASAYGVPDDDIAAGLARFRGVPNRLEQVAVVDGVAYVNDTSATAPAAAIAGVRVLGARSRTLHLIAGGADKRTDLAPFADQISATNARVYLLDGTATDSLHAMLMARSAGIAGRFASMADAVDNAAGEASAGDVVALCPGCASFGMFRNEFDRGDQFRIAVEAVKDRFARARLEPNPGG